MFPKLFGTILILFLIPCARSVLKPKHSSIQGQFENRLGALPSSKQEMVIQLAIFTDTEFNDFFQNEPKLILKYWEAVLYDVHLKYKTLPSLNISFRVTSLSNLQNNEEHALFGNGSRGQEPHSLETIASNFEILSYRKVGQIPNFDIAVLALGTYLPENKNPPCFTKGPICHGKDDETKRWHNIVFLGMKKHPALQLTRQVACILGAPSQNEFDNHLYFSWAKWFHVPDNAIHRCIFARYFAKPWLDWEPRFFCSCTTQLLATKISERLLEKPECMNKSMAEKNPLIDTENLFQNPGNIPRYTMHQQCQLLARNADAIMEAGSCVEVECGFDLNLIKFAPLDGTPCGNRGNGQCLQGECIEPKLQLVNVGTGKCMVPETGLFGLNDKPVLKNCSSIGIHVLDENDLWLEGKSRINMMYSTVSGMLLKQLKLRLNSEQQAVAKFEQNITDTAGHWFIKRVVKLQPDQFVMVHAETGFCAVAADDGVNLKFVVNCSAVNSKVRWKFVRINGTETLFRSMKDQSYKAWYLLCMNINDVALTLIFWTLTLVLFVLLWVSWKMGWWYRQEKTREIK